MIRKIIIVVLTLGAVGTGVAWICSYCLSISLPYAYVGGTVQPRVQPGVRRSVDVGNGRLRVTISSGGADVGYFGPRWQGSRWQPFATYPAFVDPTTRRHASIPFLGGWQKLTGAPGTSWYSFHIRLWCPFVLSAIYLTIAFIRGPARRWRRRRNGWCVACGYDLTGNISGICPECGTEIRKP
jgi:hypothetical protein